MRALMQSRSRWITVVLALVAVSSFAIAVQVPWWTIGEVTVGPFGVRRCFGGECAEAGLSWLQGSDLWMRSVVATRAAGFIAAFMLLMFAGAIAAKREPKLLARGVLSAVITAAAVGTYLAVAFPNVPEAHVSHGVILFGVAVVAGVAAFVAFLRRR